MTDNEIIKGINYCANVEHRKNCDNCPIKAVCDSEDYGAIKLVNDLISRQKAEIERLKILAELGNMRANDYRVMRDRALKAKAQRDKVIKDFTNFAHAAPDNPFACIYCVHSLYEGRACAWKSEHEDDEFACLGKHFEYRLEGDTK